MLLKTMGVKIGVFWVLLSTFMLNSVNAQYAPIRFTLPRLPHSEISKSDFFGNPPLEGNEPSISINPNDANDIWLAFNNNKVFHTLNGGTDWLEVETKPDVGFYGDPVIYRSASGMIYLAHLAQNPNKKWPEWFDCIVFERSTNGVEFYSKCVGQNGKMQDKPWFSLDDQVKSPYKGNIYITWTEFDKYGSSSTKDSTRIRFARSENQGATFFDPVVVSDVSGDAEDDDKTAEGATVAVMPDGKIFCFWSRNDTLWMDESIDAGRSWGKDKFLTSMRGGWNFDGVRGVQRSNGMPFSCVDAKGRIYVGYGAESPFGDRNVYYTVSVDGGKHFLPPIRINDDPNGADQFKPYFNIDRNTGLPRAIWYDTRNFATGKFAQIYTATLNATAVSKNALLSEEPCILPGPKSFYGDYIGFDAAQGRGVAAITRYHEDIGKPCIELIYWKGKKPAVKKQDPVVMINPNVGSDSLLFLACMPGETSFTIEIKSGRNLITQMIFESLDPKGFSSTEFQEFYLSRSKFPSGLYTMVMRRKNKAMKKNFWIN
jgi:hypothetical protein